MRAAARLAAALALLGLPILPGPAPVQAAGTSAHRIPLPAPVRGVDPLAPFNFLLRKDRVLKSVVPGTVDNREQITARLGPSGAPAVVEDVQRLVITGAGAYIVRELGPARAAVSLNDTNPPVLELGQVVWQGFSPGTRTLEARLTLDAGIEAKRLPLSVGLVFRDNRGRIRPLRSGAAAPTDGRVDVTLVNQSAVPAVVSVGAADVVPLAANLDLLLTAAAHPAEAVPPFVGGGLPAFVAGRLTGQTQVSQLSPLRVTGSIGVVGATADTVQGPGTTPAPGGATIAGTLSGRVTLTVGVRSGQRLAMDLDVQPWLDPRLLLPPDPAATWQQWAKSKPTRETISAATATLIQAAAATARDAEYSPYLQADTPGRDLSTFTYVMAPESATRRAGEVIEAKPAAIIATLVALVAIAGNAALLRRQL